MFISFIFTEVGLFRWLFLSIIKAWNSSRFTIIMFSLIHYTAFSDSEVKLLISSSKDFSVHEVVLSSAKLCNSAFSVQRKRSLMQMFKRMGPKIGPCGTPDNKTWKPLYYMYYLCSHSVFYRLNKKKIF